MKTTEFKAATENNITVKKAEPANVNGLPLSKAFNNESKKEEPKQPEVPAIIQPEQPKAEQTNTETFLTKKEVKEEVKSEKPALNLESTLKLVEELHRRKIQRDRLLDTIDTLEAFEIAQQEDAEETDSNHFQGCVLTIEDDERRKFSTKNPVIIQAVATFVNRMCVDRLAEIEAGITIPV